MLQENVAASSITINGNTVIDAVLWVKSRLANYDDAVWRDAVGEQVFERLNSNNSNINKSERPLLLITGHRRENFGQGFVDLCTAIKTLAQAHPDWEFVYPVHLNPNVQQQMWSMSRFSSEISEVFIQFSFHSRGQSYGFIPASSVSSKVLII